MTDCKHLNPFCRRCTLSDTAYHVCTGRRCSGREGWLSDGATGFYFLMVSLWKAETEPGSLAARNGEGVCVCVWSGSAFTMMAAVCFMNITHTRTA